MSDRIAVFNEGRIEQLASPVELYERPATAFVAGFVGTSNLLRDDVARTVLGTDGTFMIRPEKVRLAAPDAAPAPGDGLCVAEGTVREVVYLGSSTHTVVDLDAGTSLTVAHPNADALDSLERRGTRVTLSWRRDHLVALDPPGTRPDHQAAPAAL